MKNLLFALAVTILMGITGCTVQEKPTPDTFINVPVVEFGNEVPAKGEFILYFPAGKPIPVVASIKGNALSLEAENTLIFKLKNDIYAYRDWVSFDRKTWVSGGETIDFNLEVKIPGPTHPKPGVMKLLMNLK
ncbi:MAG: hypothetical protein OEM48_08590 [Gammaproteobacteria bacterium]|nr:hypothetical protein [Gammaproteobacteria bacterium]MDH3406965.1 hypothetical protein [Gammaproteobacteria bacterium]MDH3562817.1 hypothetical protein [Gammaproteobacteria bacterium]MDH5487357.1 hypothetical protein [Gammaproteobacteria bacterium]